MTVMSTLAPRLQCYGKGHPFPDIIVFNKEGAVNVILILGMPVLHVVDWHTSFPNAILLCSRTVDNTLNALLEF